MNLVRLWYTKVIYEKLIVYNLATTIKTLKYHLGFIKTSKYIRTNHIKEVWDVYTENDKALARKKIS